MVKETCLLIVWMSKQFPGEFCSECQGSKDSKTAAGGGNGHKYFESEALPKVLTQGNKMIQDLGHCAICEMLDGSPII